MSRACICERPWPDGDEDCVKCGKPLKPVKVDRPKPTKVELERRAKISAHWKGRAYRQRAA